MAKIVETVFIVKLSQLVKETSGAGQVESVGVDQLPVTLEEVVQQLLVGSDVVVEVVKA